MVVNWNQFSNMCELYPRRRKERMERMERTKAEEGSAHIKTGNS